MLTNKIIPAASVIGAEWVLVQPRATLLAAVQDITISGLTGNTHYRFKWRIHVVSAAVASWTALLLPNGDASNGRSQERESSAAAGTDSATATCRIGEVTNARSAMLIGEFDAFPTNVDREYIAWCTRSQSATNPVGKSLFGTYEGAGEITSLTFRSGAVVGWGIGTWYEIYRGSAT